MGKKLNKLAKEDDEKLVDTVRDSAQQIWQAGLGAFAVAEKEGGKVFSKLVKDGVSLQKRTKHLAEVKAPEIAESMTKMAENINRRASDSWGKLGRAFEESLSKEIKAMSLQLDKLSKAVASLGARKTSVQKPTATKSRTSPRASVRKPRAKSEKTKTDTHHSS